MVKRAGWTLMLLLAASCGGRPPPPPIPDAGPVPLPDLVHHDATGDRTLDAREPGPVDSYPHADFTVELPYAGAEQTVEITAAAHAGLVDVHLLIDTTASMDGEIDELQSALLNTVILGLNGRVPSLTFGVSKFEDVPASPFGGSSDRPFVLLQAQTDDLFRVSGAVERLDTPLGFGGDRPEDWGEALYQVATGAGLTASAGSPLVAPYDPSSWPGSGPVGGVGFRTASTRVVVVATDAPTHQPADYAGAVMDPHGVTAAIAALQSVDARVVSIISSPDVRSWLEPVAMQTGGIGAPGDLGCTTGIRGAAREPVGGVCPLVYEITDDGAGLSQSIVDAIVTLLDSAVYSEVHGEAEGDASAFVRAIEAVRVEGEADSTPQDRLPTGAPDGTPDTFTDVHADARMTFRVHFQNTRVRSTEFPQVFFVPVRLLGDGVVLTEVLVRVIVPEGPKFDGGRGDAAAGGEGGLDPDALPPPP